MGILFTRFLWVFPNHSQPTGLGTPFFPFYYPGENGWRAKPEENTFKNHCWHLLKSKTQTLQISANVNTVDATCLSQILNIPPGCSKRLPPKYLFVGDRNFLSTTLPMKFPTKQLMTTRNKVQQLQQWINMKMKSPMFQPFMNRHCNSVL